MEKNRTIPVISIVGRPNVGKSSLFNRLTGERRSVVLEQSGTTRDRIESVIRLGARSVKLVDTGGYSAGEKDEISVGVKEQIYSAMEEADLLLLVTDSMDGVTPADTEVASLLRRSNTEVKVIANKTDNDRMSADACEFYQLGFGDPEPVSCVHRRGIRKLKNYLIKWVKETDPPGYPGEQQRVRVAVIGRPNVGKSSFINKILSKKRVIVSDIPGTTRDSIDTELVLDGDSYLIIDTAGIRHKRKVKTVVDTFSMGRSRESIKRSDVVILLLDAQDGITRDDLDILSFVEDAGKGCLIAVNKWDLAEEVGDVSIEEYRKNLFYVSGRIMKYPLFFISSLTGKNAADCLKAAKVLDSNLDIRFSTPFLNRIFERSDPSDVPVPRRSKRPNFLYIVQHRNRPLEFKYFVSDPEHVTDSHISFVENRLRENLPLTGIPLRMIFTRSRKERVRKR